MTAEQRSVRRGLPGKKSAVLGRRAAGWVESGRQRGCGQVVRRGTARATRRARGQLECMAAVEEEGERLSGEMGWKAAGDAGRQSSSAGRDPRKPGYPCLNAAAPDFMGTSCSASQPCRCPPTRPIALRPWLSLYVCTLKPHLIFVIHARHPSSRRPHNPALFPHLFRHGRIPIYVR